MWSRVTELLRSAIINILNSPFIFIQEKKQEEDILQIEIVY